MVRLLRQLAFVRDGLRGALERRELAVVAGQQVRTASPRWTALV
jgi:hypothetical protein